MFLLKKGDVKNNVLSFAWGLGKGHTIRKNGLLWYRELNLWKISSIIISKLLVTLGLSFKILGTFIMGRKKLKGEFKK